MVKYEFTGSYATEGGRGVLAEGGSSRRAVVEKLAASVGGTLESFHFAFGSDDYYGIVDLPRGEPIAEALADLEVLPTSGVDPVKSANIAGARAAAAFAAGQFEAARAEGHRFAEVFAQATAGGF
jgi:uncharacterized protein with GYD domain